MSVSYQREVAAATEIAEAAGEVVMRYHGGELKVDLKPGDEPVTAADRESSALIVARLQAQFPSDVVISEECADDERRLHADRVWYVDPIDGTADFVRGENGFCVMIGLVVGGAPTVGVVHQPKDEQTYWAAPGVGAWVRSRQGEPSPLRCSSCSVLADVRLVVSKSHRDANHRRRQGGTRNFPREQHWVGRSQLGLIARGEADVYVTASNKCSSWDTVAPAAILAHAGGRLTDVDGVTLAYGRPSLSHERGLLATNGVLHEAVTSALAPVFGATS